MYLHFYFILVYRIDPFIFFFDFFCEKNNNSLLLFIVTFDEFLFFSSKIYMLSLLKLRGYNNYNIM